MGKIGKHSYCLSNLRNCDIGNFVSIAGGCYFHLPDNHACIYFPKFISCFPFNARLKIGERPDVPKDDEINLIKIGNDVWVGEHVKFMSGVKVGDGAIIGAHTVVAKDVPPYALFVGNPGIVKRYRFEKDIIDKLLKIKWWDWTDDAIKERVNDFYDIDIFISKYYKP